MKEEFYDGVIVTSVVLIIGLILHLGGREWREWELSKGETFIRDNVEYKCKIQKP